MVQASKRKKYGLYDFLKRVLTQYELLEAPPREISEILCSRFGFKKRQINMSSLGSWLRRTRKRHKENGLSIPLSTYNLESSREVASEKINDRFLGFQPTDPMAELTNKGNKKTLLNKPLYNK